MFPTIEPNLHPLIIHFPIAFLTTAVLIDLISLFGRRWVGVRIAAVILFTLGALGALAAFLTGRMAADSLTVPASVIPVLDQHADWAERTLWFFGIYAVVRLILLWFDLHGRRWAQRGAHVAAFLIGAAGLFLVVQTGLLGGSLVFKHGLAVATAMPASEPPVGMDMPKSSEGEAILRMGNDGAWTWDASTGGEPALGEDFRFVSGSPADLETMSESDSAGGAFAMLHLSGSPVLMVAGDSLTGVQEEAELNLDDFEGTIRLVHHVQDAQNYDFLGLSEGKIRLGRMEHGKPHILEEKSYMPQGWVALRVVGHGDHFRGYTGGKLVAHAHTSPLPPGPAGLYLNGSGMVLLRSIRTTPVSE